MRPLRAEPRLILEIHPDVPIGVGRGDAVDLLGDDLLEELLHLRDGVLVVRARHEVAVAEAMQ
jgi:hypothetical protein